jgi:hypothetical protein
MGAGQLRRRLCAKNFSIRDTSILTVTSAFYTHGGGTPFPNEGNFNPA